VVKNPGFTLIELMVVMVLIGILTAMIIPEMKGTFQDALLRSTGRELVNVFSIAYSRSVSLNQIHRVRLDPANGRYMIEKAVSGRAALRAASESGDFIAIQDVPGSQGTLDSRISIQIRPVSEMLMNSSGEPARAEPMTGTDEPVDTIFFYPDGTADGRELVLRDRDGFGLSLRISPITARVELSALERE
jgi:type II secretion system protein H